MAERAQSYEVLQYHCLPCDLGAGKRPSKWWETVSRGAANIDLHIKLVFGEMITAR